jgi:hypothetical protein
MQRHHSVYTPSAMGKGIRHVIWWGRSLRYHYEDTRFYFQHIYEIHSAVGIAIDYELEDRGWSSSPGRVKNFHFSISFRPALGPTQPPIQWVPSALSSRLKRPGREADHSPPTSAEVKENVGLCIHSPIRPHGVVHRNNFTFAHGTYLMVRRGLLLWLSPMDNTY